MMSRHDNWRSVTAAAIAASLLFPLTGCMAKRTLTQTSRSGIEQLLLTGATRRAATRLKASDLDGTTVYLEVTGLTKDAEFARQTVANELQSRGVVIVTETAKATHIVKILVLALGTDQTEAFVGVPAMSSLLLPIPEITLFRRQRLSGQSRLLVSVIDGRTGRVIGRAEEVGGETAFTRMTILPFLFEWTDLDQPVEQQGNLAAPQG